MICTYIQQERKVKLLSPRVAQVTAEPQPILQRKAVAQIQHRDIRLSPSTKKNLVQVQKLGKVVLAKPKRDLQMLQALQQLRYITYNNDYLTLSDIDIMHVFSFPSTETKDIRKIAR